MAHAEVLALQQWLGISYKDACHRLYLAELEKMRSEEKLFKMFANLKVLMEKALESCHSAVNKVDRSASVESKGDDESEEDRV